MCAVALKPRLYWDSSVFIEHFNDDPKGRWNREIRTQLDFAKRGRIQIVTSVLSMTEVVFVKPLEYEGKRFVGGHQVEMDKLWNDFPAILTIRMDPRIARLARDIHRWGKHLQIKELGGADYVHLATAMYTKGVGAIHTRDQYWFPYEKYVKLRITYPEAPTDPAETPTLLEGTSLD